MIKLLILLVEEEVIEETIEEEVVEEEEKPAPKMIRIDYLEKFINMTKTWIQLVEGKITSEELAKIIEAEARKRTRRSRKSKK